MTTSDVLNRPAPFRQLIVRSDILAFGFGAASAMWTVGYFTHIPEWTFPSFVVFFLLLAVMLAFGFWAGCWVSEGWRAGLAAGVIASILNLLILGSLLGGDEPNQVVPSALVFIPGSIVVCALLMSVGAGLGALTRKSAPAPINGMGGFALVAAATTFLLLAAGGMVTSKEAGLAVVDWPNSFGYNMFLYPLSRMTGGIYYEHAHRLLGSLVGLTTITLALLLQFRDSRSWVKTLGWICAALVVIQGILGGLRVTGSFTLSVYEGDMAPNLTLAIFHGVLGQIFFALMVGLAVVVSSRWVGAEIPSENRSVKTDRNLGLLMIAALLVQLILGALLRHMSVMLMVHITMGTIVLALAYGYGVRAWGCYPEKPLLGTLGLFLVAAVSVQFLLGFGALWGVSDGRDPDNMIRVLLPTLHQSLGALIFATVAALHLWIYRLLTPQRIEA